MVIPFIVLLHIHLFIQFHTTNALTTTGNTPPSQQRSPAVGTAQECRCTEWYYCDIRNYYLDDKKKCENREFISCCERPSLKKLPSLIADCGLVNEHDGVTQTLKRSVPSNNISNVMATYGNDPWNVALYRKTAGGLDKPILICSGSLISPAVVITAAHCFYDGRLRKMESDNSKYEIAVGKFTRDYEKQDGPSQKIHKIKNLITYPKSYNPGLSGTHGSDIILITLEKPVAVDNYVRPICLDWSGIIFGSLVDKKTLGRVVSWRSTTNDEPARPSEYLLTNDIPYIDYNSCLGKVNPLSADHFCAGSPSNPGMLKGGSGAGLVFKYKDRYFLRGLASTRNKDDNFITGYTDLDLYMSWIRENV